MALSLRMYSIVTGAALLLTSATASADRGQPDIGKSAQSPGGQQLRFHFADDGRCLRVVSAGVRTRNAVVPGTALASGTITLPPGPTATNIRWAGLYWVILGGAAPVNAVQLNGSAVLPVALPVTASPCWGESSAFAYYANVTTLVVPGANLVSGLDDSGLLGLGPESEGASLVVVYESDTSGACEIVVLDGNDLLNTCGQQIDNLVPAICPPGLPATIHFIGADGQNLNNADDNQLWNGVPVGDNDDFDASDPPAPGAAANISWDTDKWGVVSGPPSIASVNTLCTGNGDCVDWVATVLEVGVRECKPVGVQQSSWDRVKRLYR